MSGFTVRIAEIEAHTRTIDAQAARTEVAAEAGSHLTSLDDAYGLLCRPFSDMLTEPQQRGTEALTKAASTLHSLRERVSEAAEAYQDAENEIEALMEALVKQLDAVANGIPSIGGPR